MSDLDVFHIMRTTRPMRRIKPDPVPQELIEEILDAGTWAPNSQNSQPYRFLVVRDRESCAFFGDRYEVAMAEAFADAIPREDDQTPQARNLRRALTFSKEVKDVPVLLVICGKRDWPFAVPDEELFFQYRDGRSGSGRQIFNRYDAESMSWRRVADEPFLDGRRRANAYPVGPVAGPDGRFHLVWMWRERAYERS